MTQPQMTGLVVCLIGLAALIVSVGTAWTLSCLFLVGAVLCYFGVTAIV